MPSSNQKKGGARAGAGGPALGGQAAGESRNLVVRLPAQMHDQLDELAAQTKQTRSEAARAALARGLDGLLQK